MATGVDVVGEVREISLSGRGIETARLYADKNRNEDNLRTIDTFLLDLVDTLGDPKAVSTWQCFALARCFRLDHRQAPGQFLSSSTQP